MTNMYTYLSSVTSMLLYIIFRYVVDVRSNSIGSSVIFWARDNSGWRIVRRHKVGDPPTPDEKCTFLY